MMVLKINLNVYINNITSKNRCSPGWTGLRETPWRYDYDLMTILLPASFSSSSRPSSIPTLSFYSAIFRQNKASFYRFPSSSKLAMISTYCSLFPTIHPPTTSARRSSVYNRIKRGAKNDSVLYMFNGTHLDDQEEVGRTRTRWWVYEEIKRSRIFILCPIPFSCVGPSWQRPWCDKYTFLYQLTITRWMKLFPS